ncbi:hypothetical protein ACFYWX_26115 [Streptomyces sp. NPDC002888]|uniref:hypothetical protein n=1 Tax=Streptomyces sp. NPDC002888 TaxID=3364668 RepID=UPI0036955B91
MPDDETGCRLEQRQDFHTLYWIRSGAGRQVIDGKPTEVGSPTLTLVGRGQVYRCEHMSDIDGAVISFGDDLLYEGSAAQVNPVWLVGRYGAPVSMPVEDAARMDRLVDSLAAEAQRPQDALSVEVQRHLLLTLLLLAQRHYDGARAHGAMNDDGDARLHRRFVALLERDFAHFHIADFVAWNNRRWDMQAYYHASDVYVEMYGKATDGRRSHRRDEGHPRRIPRGPDRAALPQRRAGRLDRDHRPLQPRRGQRLHRRPPPQRADGRGVPVHAAARR